MADKKPTDTSPEKKLLEIIEQGQAAAESAGTTVKSARVKKVRQQPLFSLAAVQAGVAAGGRVIRTHVLSAARKALELRHVNQGLLLFSVALVFILVSFLGNYRRGSAQIIELSWGDIQKINEKEMKSLGKTTVGPLDGILSKIIDRTKKRDIFKSVKNDKPVSQEHAVPKETELLKSLKLVGISYSPVSADTYAMIEDVSSKTTYFMKTGETLMGAQIKSIEKDRVILSYQSSAVELR